MSKVINGVVLVLIALATFFASGFLFIGSIDDFNMLEDYIIQNVLIRSLGYWMLGFIPLLVIAVINYTMYKRSSNSNLRMISIGAILNFVFALLGSLYFFLNAYDF